MYLPNDKECYYQTKQMLKKARQGKHSRHSTILSRWYASESYRSLYAIGWREKHIMLYDRIALEKRIYVATEAERIQNPKHWILTLNTEGPPSPPNQRPNFARARMQTITRRAPGKDPRRIQNHSSQSTNKTANRKTIRGQRQI